MSNTRMAARRWGIVLAGGEGSRLRPWTMRRLGFHRPKQYCAFLGERSMLEHTIDRTAGLILPERLVTIIGRGHWAHLEEPRRQSVPGMIIEQPGERDTGPGVFLPLTYVMALEPEATVAVFPSDHFIFPKTEFQRLVEQAFDLAEFLQDRIVLLGAAADRPEPEYGWIEPGRALEEGPLRSACAVERFVEKPDLRTADSLFRRGCLWNTLIMVFKGKALWSMGQALFPKMLHRFESLRLALIGGGGAPEAAAVYEGMERVNFSSGLLARLPAKTVVVPMHGVLWNDWGRPERISETLAAMGSVLATEPADADGLVHPLNNNKLPPLYTPEPTLRIQ